MEFNREALNLAGKVAGKIGKAIIVEGTKAVVLNSVSAAVKTTWAHGSDSLSKLDLDDFLKGHSLETKAILEAKREMFMKKNGDKTPKTSGRKFWQRKRGDEVVSVEAEVTIIAEED